MKKRKKIWKTFSGLGVVSVVVSTSALSMVACSYSDKDLKANNASKIQAISNASKIQAISNASKIQAISNASKIQAMNDASKNQAMSDASKSQAMSDATKVQAMKTITNDAMSDASQNQALSKISKKTFPLTIGVNDYTLGLKILKNNDYYSDYKNWLDFSYWQNSNDKQVDWLNTYAQMHTAEQFDAYHDGGKLSWINVDDENSIWQNYIHINPAKNKVFHDSFLLNYNSAGNLFVSGYTTYIPVQLHISGLVDYGYDDTVYTTHINWTDDADFVVTTNLITGKQTFDLRPPSSFYTQHPVAQNASASQNTSINRNRYCEYEKHTYSNFPDVKTVEVALNPVKNINLGSLINGPLNYLQNKPLPNDSRLAFRHTWDDQSHDQDDNDVNTYQKIPVTDLENGSDVNSAYNHPAFDKSSKIIVTDSWNLNNLLKPQLTDFAVDGVLYSDDPQKGTHSPDEDFDWLYSPVKHTETMELNMGSWGEGNNTDFYQKIALSYFDKNDPLYLSDLLMIASHGQLFTEEII